MCIRVLCRNIRADVLIEELEDKRNAVRKYEMLAHVLKLYSINYNGFSQPNKPFKYTSANELFAEFDTLQCFDTVG